MELTDVLRKYYPEQQIRDTVALLKDQGLYEKFEASAIRFYTRMAHSDGQKEHEPKRKIVSDYAKAIFKLLDSECTENAGDDACMTLIGAVAVIINDAMMVSETPLDEFRGILKDVIVSSFRSIKDKSLLAYLIISLIQERMTGRSIIAGMVKEDTGSYRPIFLIWNKDDKDKEHMIWLDAFLHDMMKTFKGMKSMHTTELLFTDTLQLYKVIMPLEHLYDFLCLLCLLHTCGRITCSPRKGLFVLLQQHLHAAEGETLPNRKHFRMLKREVLDNKQQNEKIREKIKPLYFKYAIGENKEKIFNDFFSRKSIKQAQ